ncbi:DUF1173 domain-containing protein (plasmid) [Paraburkholderia sp. D15]|uniref:DUF1173 family protein n=1 Tax=Paraburkholderia sp. D15 TaxID=2880218 RepID=UPI002478E371|nr:DUF1173 family protein [Paraburkholderia sp. D15]WGS55068.1 DUF1173 domain-containing protein [Paraburkholderia sp. D15]
MSSVSFDNATYPLSDVQENPARYLARLERAKVTPGHAVCLCVPRREPLRLVIRRYGKFCHLAGWPEDGHRHFPGGTNAPACPFYKDRDAQSSNGDVDTTAAIVATPGGINAKLDIALVQRESASGARRTAGTGSSGTSRRAASLLAFLQTLWMTARLNRWSGLATSRHWGICNAMLLAELGDAVVNGEPAQTALHVMRRYEEADRAAINAEFDAFLDGVAITGVTSCRGLIIGEVNELARTQFGYSLSLRQSARKYYCSTELVAHAEKTFAHAWRALGDRSARVVAILLVERTSKGHLRLVDLAAMLCSAAFLPCDSIHEVALANRLVTEHRAFEKPMRMTRGEDMLPDFELTDTAPRYHVEVYGMNGLPAYEARKEAKRELRRQRGIPALEWDVDKTPLPQLTLPPAAVAAASRQRSTT